MGGLAYTPLRPKFILKKMKNNENQENKKNLWEVQGSPKEVFTSAEAAAYLGISKSCLYKLTMGRKIPHYKSAKLCYFDRQELIEWMKAHKVQTQEELEAKAKEIVRKKGGKK